MAKTVRIGDIGTYITATITDDGVALDISTANAVKMYFTKPSGAVVEKIANFDSDGKDGKIRYNADVGDFDEVGLWEFQAYVEIGLYKLKSKIATFTVERVIK
jgi:hypothetical protein